MRHFTAQKNNIGLLFNFRFVAYKYTKINMKFTTWIITFLFASVLGYGQSVSSLIKHYSGIINWDKNTSTLTFLSTGEINFPDKYGDGTDLENDYKHNFWNVPKNVKHIIISKNVQVTGAFHVYADITIKGKDRKTSVIYGTPLNTWADKNNPGGVDLREWYYSQIQVFDGVTNIENLTLLNPFSYFVRGFGPIVNMKKCDLIDNRGGHHNHSDGYCGGNGSLVEDCYFEAGDDVFKAYFDYTVKDCTINMITNSVPIQLGWGNYPDGTICNFKNLKVVGNSGRFASDNAVICGRNGNYNVTINIDGLDVDNPNAVLVKLFEKEMTLNGEIKNANIKVKSYYGNNKGKDNLTICGEKERKNSYQCAF